MKALDVFYYFIILGLVLSSGSLYPQSKPYQKEIAELHERAIRHIYKNKDSAYHYFNKIKSIGIQNNDSQEVYDAYININRVADFFYDLETTASILYSLDSLISKRPNFFDGFDNPLLERNALRAEKGAYYYKLNDFAASKRYFNTIINLTKELPDSVYAGDHFARLSKTYNYLGLIYQKQGKYDLARQYYSKNLSFIKQKRPGEHEKVMTVNNYLATLLAKDEKFHEANGYLRRSLNYYQLNSSNKSILFSVVNLLVRNNLSLNQTDSAEFYLKIAKDYIENDFTRKMRYHRSFARFLKQTKQYNKAETELKAAIEVCRENWGDKKRGETASIYQELAELYKTAGAFDKALDNYNLAINLLYGKEAGQRNINLNPLIKLCKQKAALLNTEFKDYKESLKTVFLGIHVLDSIKPGFKNETDRLFLAEDAFPLFEKGMQAAYELYNNTGDKKYIDTLFFINEKSRSSVLLEAVLAAKASEFGKVPSEILEKEKQLKATIAHFEKRIELSRQPTSQTDEDGLFKNRQDYRNLLEEMESKYGAYYDLKYNFEVASLGSFQKLMASDELFLSYFYGAEIVYILTIGRNTREAYRLQRTENLDSLISEVHSALADPKSSPNTLLQKSGKLYGHILKKSVKNADKKKLTIIREGPLNYIPFGSLNVAQTGAARYLIEDYSINYISSVTLYQQLLEKKPKQNKLLAYAPSFNQTHRSGSVNASHLAPLAHNTTEAQGLFKWFNGKLVSGEQATTTNFLNQAGAYDLIHMATHAVFNDSLPEYSFLAFSHKSKADPQFLYAKDVYNLELKSSNLITLSTCESGLGQLKKGEGFLSLSRAFFFSGASSVCYTLWKINDASSSDLMTAFYRNLSRGYSKSEALQRAKKAFLKSNKDNARVHPYYWSGFIVSGNNSPLKTDNAYMKPILISLSVLGLLILGGLFYRRLRNKAN